MYVYPDTPYDPEIKGYKKLSNTPEESIYYPLDINLQGELVRFEHYDYQYLPKANPVTLDFPFNNLVSKLYYHEKDGTKINMVNPSPTLQLWDYDIMGALRQLNSKNLYVIYDNVAILRSSIDRIEFYPEISKTYYSNNEDKNWKVAYTFFSSGLKTPILKIYRKCGGCSLVKLVTSIDEAEQIFNIPITIMQNPNQIEQEELNR